MFPARAQPIWKRKNGKKVQRKTGRRPQISDAGAQAIAEGNTNLSV